MQPHFSTAADDTVALIQLMAAAPLLSSQPDAASWQQGEDGIFSVSSCYTTLSRNYIPFGPENRFDLLFLAIWKVEVPTKVKAFKWRCFLNKVPTKDSLLKRGLINSTSNLKCVFCNDFDETLHHSFLFCRNTVSV